MANIQDMYYYALVTARERIEALADAMRPHPKLSDYSQRDLVVLSAPHERRHDVFLLDRHLDHYNLLEPFSGAFFARFNYRDRHSISPAGAKDIEKLKEVAAVGAFRTGQTVVIVAEENKYPASGPHLYEVINTDPAKGFIRLRDKVTKQIRPEKFDLACALRPPIEQDQYNHNRRERKFRAEQAATSEPTRALSLARRLPLARVVLKKLSTNLALLNIQVNNMGHLQARSELLAEDIRGLLSDKLATRVRNATQNETRYNKHLNDAVSVLEKAFNPVADKRAVNEQTLEEDACLEVIASAMNSLNSRFASFSGHAANMPRLAADVKSFVNAPEAKKNGQSLKFADELYGASNTVTDVCKKLRENVFALNQVFVDILPEDNAQRGSDQANIASDPDNEPV